MAPNKNENENEQFDLLIRNARIALDEEERGGGNETYDIFCDSTSKNVRSIVPHDPASTSTSHEGTRVVDANGGLVIPSYVPHSGLE